LSIAENPLLPCHECGTEGRFMTMKWSDKWELEYLNDGSGQWVAYCPECSVRTEIQQERSR
jgi:hypothetical protein